MYIPAIIMIYIVHRTAWPLSPHILTTLATGVLITTSLHPLLTQTACGLCAHSSSSHVLCAPPTQNKVPTTRIPKTVTFLSPWSSSAPLRIFFYEQLEQWSQTELGSCMNPRLSPLSMLAVWILMATSHLLFRISTRDDRSRPSNSDVLSLYC